MQTECPHCHTVFRVDGTDLDQANCQVRCGHCLAIFTAENPLDLISYPEVANENATEEAAAETADPTDENLINFAMGSALGLDLEPSKGTEAAIVADVIPPELRAEERKEKSHVNAINTTLLALLTLIGIATGLFQYAYYNRSSLVKIPELRSGFQVSCELIGCTPPEPEDTSLISLSSKNIFTHPNVENALMVSASIVNQAKFAQHYPVIELRFNNVRGEVIAARRFYAQEYLGIPVEQISNMQPGRHINISLEIKDPGNDMVSYEFEFL
ncbi:hypothetical protein MNBD_GAMMA11-703 [hydrothermal vent metagenome]|uniref:Zinc finger/thioredoxin putative domain-containing protein n=1 Tax=hydrothermal vent metagenome TaxID=652676 RepID=A0A3B0XQ59_9ZZZZ